MLGPIAHQIEIDRSVGATLHVEPNDNPVAGEPSEIWFALTQKGGESLALEDCQCQLTMYTGDVSDRDATTNPIAQPDLRAMDVEGYQNIPASTIVFPQVGQYTLILTGSPQADAPAFEPFELRFPVTVAQGTPALTTPTPQASPTTITVPAPDNTNPLSRSNQGGMVVSENPAPSITSPWAGGILLLSTILILGILLTMGWTLYQGQHQKQTPFKKPPDQPKDSQKSTEDP